MATGPEHYTEAEQHLAYAMSGGLGMETDFHLAAAQAHATLALAAATAMACYSPEGMNVLDYEAWDKVAGVQEDEDDNDPYEGLTNADVLTADELYLDERAAEAELDAADEERWAEENVANQTDDEHYDVDDEDEYGGEDE